MQGFKLPAYPQCRVTPLQGIAQRLVLVQDAVALQSQRVQVSDALCIQPALQTFHAVMGVLGERDQLLQQGFNGQPVLLDQEPVGVWRIHGMGSVHQNTDRAPVV